MPALDKNSHNFTVKEAFSSEFDPEPELNPSSTLTSDAQTLSLDPLVKRIQQALKKQGLGNEFLLSIRMGNQTAFKAIPGQEPTINTLAPEQIALIKKALDNPQGLEGSIRIYIGTEKVFHVRHGEILVDTLSLVQKQQLSPATIEELKSHESPPTSENLSVEQRLETLEKLIKQQQQQIDDLTRQLENVTRFAPGFALEKLGVWFSQMRENLLETGQSLREQLTSRLQANQVTLKTYVREVMTGMQTRISEAAQIAHSEWDKTIQGAQDRILDSAQALSNTVQIKTGEFALGAMVTATTQVASLVGEPTPIELRLPVDSQSLWDYFSEKANDFHSQETDRPFVPAQLTVVSAQYALQEGIGKRTVREMLQADPEFRRLWVEQGEKQAQQYADLALAKATRLTRQGKPPQLQTEPQQTAQKSQDEPEL